MDNTVIANERLQVIEVLGRKALFIKDHVVQRYLPNGLYAYDFQAEEGNPFAALVLCALVNRTGTIILGEPIDLGPESLLALAKDDVPVFAGYSMTPGEYLKANYSVGYRCY